VTTPDDIVLLVGAQLVLLLLAVSIFVALRRWSRASKRQSPHDEN